MNSAAEDPRVFARLIHDDARRPRFKRNTDLSVMAFLFCVSCADDHVAPTHDTDVGNVASDGTDVVADAQQDTYDADVEQGTVELETLSAAGPFHVGYRETEASYERPDGGERTVRIALWYPTNDEDGEAVFYLDFLNAPGVWRDAEPTGEPGLPVLVYSHGNYGYAEASPFLVEHFASHGWLVVAPDHTGNTIGQLGTPRDTAIYHLRAADVSAALDWLEALPDDDPIAPMRSDEVIAAGHSFGGYTVMTTVGAGFSTERLDGCEEDPDAGGAFCSTFDDTQRGIFDAGVRDERILAGILMAAGNIGELGADGVGQIRTPVLQITGGRDFDVTNESNGDPIWAALPPGDNVRVDLPRGCHQTFAIGCGMAGDLESERGFEIVRTYALAFARRWALSDESVIGILDGSRPVEAEEAVVSTR